MLRKVPMIVILGSTGTGKTKLSLELSERFGGEIISADSMQVYANLDIVTAKATKEEQTRARHHLLDVAKPTEPYTVVHFRNAALPIIEDLLAKAKLPIIVGGTNYYIESLLWDILVSDEVDDNKESAGAVIDKNSQYFSAADMSGMESEQLHKHLMHIDFDSANRIHPNNKRKIMRAIEVYQKTGQTLTAKLQAQRQQPGGNRLGGPLRYTHTLLFWLRCNQDVLNARLDKRVDDMLQLGLLAEVRAFHNLYNADCASTQTYTKGVLQTIGYKEFVPYLVKYNEDNDKKIEEYLSLNNYKLPSKETLSANTAELPTGLALLSDCLEELKLVTRRYSKKQIKWIKNRFLSSKGRQVPQLYELDTSDVSAWHENVYKRAEHIIECYRNEQVCEIEPLEKQQHPGAGFNEETSNYCDICARHFIGEYQWNLHLKSNKHKRRKESVRKQQQLAANVEPKDD